MAEITYEDGEIIGLDTDGCVLQWDVDTASAYNSGETPEQYGLHNIRPHEMERINIARSGMRIAAPLEMQEGNGHIKLFDICAKLVAEVFVEPAHYFRPTGRAYTKMLAASPMMLDTLKMLYKAHEDGLRAKDDGCGFHPRLAYAISEAIKAGDTVYVGTPLGDYTDWRALSKELLEALKSLTLSVQSNPDELGPTHPDVASALAMIAKAEEIR